MSIMIVFRLLDWILGSTGSFYWKSLTFKRLSHISK